MDLRRLSAVGCGAVRESLQRQGYWVVGVRLSGHGTAPSGLRAIVWEDMAAAVRLGMEQLASRVGTEPIHVIGNSTGAPIAGLRGMGFLREILECTGRAVAQDRIEN